MIDMVRLWFAARTRREQTMVAFAAVLAVITFAWGVTAVSLAAMQSAHSRYADAVRALADTETRVAAVRELVRSPVAPPAGPMDAVVRDKAQAAGFSLSSNTPQADGSATIGIASARPAALFAWIAALERDGVIVDHLAATDNGDKTLAVQMTLRKRGA